MLSTLNINWFTVVIIISITPKSSLSKFVSNIIFNRGMFDNDKNPLIKIDSQNTQLHAGHVLHESKITKFSAQVFIETLFKHTLALGVQTNIGLRVHQTLALVPKVVCVTHT